MIAVSEPSRSTTSLRGSSPPSSFSNSPGVTTQTGVPVSDAASWAASANIVKTTAAFASASVQVYATSRPLSSGFIGTTTAPRRRMP